MDVLGPCKPASHTKDLILFHMVSSLQNKTVDKSYANHKKALFVVLWFWNIKLFEILNHVCAFYAYYNATEDEKFWHVKRSLVHFLVRRIGEEGQKTLTLSRDLLKTRQRHFLRTLLEMHWPLSIRNLRTCLLYISFITI